MFEVDIFWTSTGLTNVMWEAAPHQECHRLVRERREAQDGLRRARLYLEERKLQRKKELKDQAVEQHKLPEREKIVKKLHTSKQKSPNPPPDGDYYLKIHYKYKGESWFIQIFFGGARQGNFFFGHRQLLVTFPKIFQQIGSC